VGWEWESTLASYAAPVIGDLPVDAVDLKLVLAILEPIWHAKPETASRLRGRLETVLDWAAVRGYRQGDNPARWRGHLDKLLPARAKVRKVEHHGVRSPTPTSGGSCTRYHSATMWNGCTFGGMPETSTTNGATNWRKRRQWSGRLWHRQSAAAFQSRVDRILGFDPLNDAHPDTVFGGDLAHADVTCLQIREDGGFGMAFRLRPSQPLALLPRPRQSGLHPLADHRTLEFGEHPQHLEHRLAAGGGVVSIPC